LSNELVRALDRLLHRGAGGVKVGVGGGAHSAAEQFVHGTIGALSRDVPQRHVESRNRVVRHRTLAPIPRETGEPHQVLDVAGVAADHETGEVLLDEGNYGVPALCQRRAPQTEEAGHVRVDAHHDEWNSFRRGHDRSYARDACVVGRRPGLSEGGECLHVGGLMLGQGGRLGCGG
jgi:hypothetical protein